MMKYILVLVVLVATLFLVISLSTVAGAQTPLLPGEPTTSLGVPSYVFGTNDGPEYGSPNFDTLTGSGSPQAAVAQAGLTFLRIWSFSGDTKAYVLSKVTAAENTNETCLFVLGTYNLAWMEKTIGWVDDYCHLFEFGNEPDGNGVSMATYTGHWIKFIPVLRAMFPGNYFGGPVLTWSGGGSATGYPDGMAYFLAKTDKANVRADFVSYHDYECTKETSKASCLADISANTAWNWNNVIQYEVKYYGAEIPTGVSEYNFDPGTSNLYNWSSDGSFMTSYTDEQVDAYVSLGAAFANEYTTLNYAGYGDLDMFSDSAPYGPKPQFTALASEIEKYR